MRFVLTLDGPEFELDEELAELEADLQVETAFKDAVVEVSDQSLLSVLKANTPWDKW